MIADAIICRRFFDCRFDFIDFRFRFFAAAAGMLRFSEHTPLRRYATLMPLMLECYAISPRAYAIERLLSPIISYLPPCRCLRFAFDDC